MQTKEDLKIANLASFATSALSNASYLRVHDVELTKDTIMIIESKEPYVKIFKIVS